MYHRYAPKPNPHLPKQGKPTAGEAGNFRQPPQGHGTQKATPVLHQPSHEPQKRNKDTVRYPQTDRSQNQRSVPLNAQRAKQRTPEKPACKKNILTGDAILGLLPPSLYNSETKQILGLFSAEDLLLVALILILLGGEREEDTILIYLLLYILVSEYIDLPF